MTITAETDQLPCHARKPAPRGRRIRRIIGHVVGGLLMTVSAGMLILTLTAPPTIEQGYAQLRGTINDVSASASEAQGVLPSVKLGVQGRQDELDWCDGTFIEMVSYQSAEQIPPHYADHNSCGGDVVLNRTVGTQLTIDELVGLCKASLRSSRAFRREPHAVVYVLGASGAARWA